MTKLSKYDKKKDNAPTISSLEKNIYNNKKEGNKKSNEKVTYVWIDKFTNLNKGRDSCGTDRQPAGPKPEVGGIRLR